MKQSNLSKRVEKAKSLTYSHNPYEPGRYQTWGSKDSEYGKKYYRIALSWQYETITTPDGKKNILVFVTDCQKDTGNGQQCNCPGNERHTVCYHSLGAIYRSFEQAKVKRLLSFFETYESAVKMSFGGVVSKVKSANGPGVVWCTIKDWPANKPEIIIKEEASMSKLSPNESLKIKEGKLFDFQKDIIAASLKKKKGRLSVKENIDLMRGSEDDEGID